MLDILKFCQANRVPFITSGNAHCRANWVQLQCPQCGSRGSHGGWYLGFSLERGCFSCYRCGKVKFWDVVLRLLRTNDREHANRIVSQFQLGKRFEPAAKPTRLKTLPEPPDCGELQPAHKKYLRGRGFIPEALVDEWGLRGTGRFGGVWSWRVVIPVKNSDGRVVAYQGRSIGDANSKYRFTEDKECLEDPDTLIYGLDRVVGNSVIVVEGCPGVWRLGPGAVGLFGIDWKLPQADRLREWDNRFILFDPEPMAQKRAEKLAEHLSIFGGNTEILTGFDTDPGEFSRGQVRRIRRELGLKELAGSMG